MPKNIMEIDLRFLRYSEKIARAYSAIAQNSTLMEIHHKHFNFFLTIIYRWYGRLNLSNFITYVIIF